MNRESIYVPGVAKPIAPYSPAVKAAGLVFVSGQLPIDSTGRLPDGMGPQTKQCLENVKAVLAAAGVGLESVVKCTVFITNMDEFGTMNDEYGKFFPKEPPARSTVEVSRLAKGALVEIEAIALA